VPPVRDGIHDGQTIVVGDFLSGMSSVVPGRERERARVRLPPTSTALTRWRRGHMHFSPAARPLLQAGSPEWSVASEARLERSESLDANGDCAVERSETAERSRGERSEPQDRREP
jgi:hypothetical protein